MKAESISIVLKLLSSAISKRYSSAREEFSQLNLGLMLRSELLLTGVSKLTFDGGIRIVVKLLVSLHSPIMFLSAFIPLTFQCYVCTLCKESVSSNDTLFTTLSTIIGPLNLETCNW